METMKDVLEYVTARLLAPDVRDDVRGMRAEDFVLRFLLPYTEGTLRGYDRLLTERTMGATVKLEQAMQIVALETLDSRLRRAATCFGLVPFKALDPPAPKPKSGLTLREALEYARKHERAYVAYGTPPIWDEYGVQHYWADGVLHWTAGMTVGGVVTGRFADRRLTKSLDEDGFHVYAKWRGQEPIR